MLRCRVGSHLIDKECLVFNQLLFAIVHLHAILADLLLIFEEHLIHIALIGHRIMLLFIALLAHLGS